MEATERSSIEPQITYNSHYGTHVESSLRDRLRREVYGDDYPAEAAPRSYLTLTELRDIALDLRVGPNQTFLDLGCGQGGPGLWVSRGTGAACTGVDTSAVGIATATERASLFGVANSTRFMVADITATGLPDASFDGAMSVDVLWFVSDKRAVLGECARILKPGGRFVFTNWERDRMPPPYLPAIGDHRPLLEDAGFAVEKYQIQNGAEDRRRAYYQQLIAAEEELTREAGEEDAKKIMFEAKANLGLIDGTDYLLFSRRIYVVARKR